jgi:hypothetical protein
MADKDKVKAAPLSQYRVKGTDEVYPHVETLDDMVKLQLDENTQGWYHCDQLEAPEEKSGYSYNPAVQAP